MVHRTNLRGENWSGHEYFSPSKAFPTMAKAVPTMALALALALALTLL